MNARRVSVALSVVLLVALLPFAFGSAPDERPRYKSPLGLAIDPTGKIAYVALHTSNSLAVVDLRAGCVLCEIPVGKKPYDVALRKGIAYVTCEADDTLVAVDVAKRNVLRVLKVGQAPRGVSVDPSTGMIQVVCHDEKVLWRHEGNILATWKFQVTSSTAPIPPQPEGNYARASNLELAVIDGETRYRQRPRPHNLFMRDRPKEPRRDAFNPVLDLDVRHFSMDLVAHTRPRWFISTAIAPEGRIFTNAFSFRIRRGTPAVVLLDEPDKGYPDPTDVVVKLPTKEPGKPFLTPFSNHGIQERHPLQGSKVFISSGGADTVVVLDLDKAAQHAEANPTHFGMNQGGMGMSAGGMMSGGWGGGGMNQGMGGTMSGGWGGGINMGNGGGLNMGSGGAVGGPPRANPGGGTPPRLGAGANGINGGAPGAGGGTPGMGMGSGINTGGMNMGGMQMGMGGMMGWNGGFGVPREDLKASANYIIARLQTQANPRRMALTPDGKTLVVSNHLADSLTLIDAEKLHVIRHIDLGGPRPDLARRGEIIFHSARFTVQQQFTCASCHPGNGSDGLTWVTSPDGKGEPFNTRALFGVRDTGPFGWKGESETLEGRAKNTMREVHKHQLSDAAASAIAAYLETLDPPRPLPQKEKDQPAIARGKALFFGKGNCKSCHRGDAFTSDSPRAVILDQHGKLTPFDVPSLRGVGRTAPYLHDGRAATLEEIFLKHNPERRHGRAHELTRSELSDLVLFLKSL